MGADATVPRWVEAGPGGSGGWDGPSRETRAEAERDRWRHPNLLCWLRALWFDYGWRRLA